MRENIYDKPVRPFELCVDVIGNDTNKVLKVRVK